MSLINAIKNGESKIVEFKEKLPGSDAVAKTVIAFSNTGGGRLIIGVTDQGKIIGLDNSIDILELRDKVASIIYDRCYPNVLPDIYTTTIDNKVLLVIEVYRGNLLPYYLKKIGKNEGVYIRVGATNRKASVDNILELERQRMNLSYDQEVNREVRFEYLDMAPIISRFDKLDKPVTQSVMKNLKLIHEENGIIYPTNGLLILLGYLEHAKIKCSRFKGMTMDVFLDSKEYKGDLFTQLDHAESFIKNHIKLGSEIKGLQREDQYEIPIEAIRESLVNAVVHRDYSNEGRDIKVGIYDDMINIVSPGAFPSTITQEDILEGRSEIRNKVIARVFKELNYIEQWGSGIRRIKSSCKTRGLKEPEIVEKGDFVDVSLYREMAETKQVHKKVTELTEQEKAIIEYLKRKDSRITTQDVKSILDIEDRRARGILKGLVDRGLIERKGGGPSTFYQIKLSGSAG
ncbi:ATP-dependent DNA helicase [Peptoclostridium acidaminophilum DSM 3953]|uniref:ATP-dependent DNA helicase n=1 Tax=Peptoclostridium acidaminophilum DSM 3953 TaxID=1286171 RepID=W8TM68_PEPAC|nr:RNA-binding domain-containing protein [Peptoclostridium acidaminophilum]AHM57302.1 ATP-dependent DNA helicase [Peptoclostridium acidaminophilum DSM 3953]